MRSQTLNGLQLLGHLTLVGAIGAPETGTTLLLERHFLLVTEHIHCEVIKDVPHRHTVSTIPKYHRVFLKYDRSLNAIFFKAAWGALSQVLGINEHELAAIFTAQTATDALNYYPHLHGLRAD